MNTPVLGPLEKRLAEAQMQRREDAVWWRETSMVMEHVHDADVRALRTATWLAASGWLIAITLACVLVAR